MRASRVKTYGSSIFCQYLCRLALNCSVEAGGYRVTGARGSPPQRGLRGRGGPIHVHCTRTHVQTWPTQAEQTQLTQADERQWQPTQAVNRLDGSANRKHGFLYSSKNHAVKVLAPEKLEGRCGHGSNIFTGETVRLILPFRIEDSDVPEEPIEYTVHAINPTYGWQQDMTSFCRLLP